MGLCASFSALHAWYLESRPHLPSPARYPLYAHHLTTLLSFLALLTWLALSHWLTSPPSCHTVKGSLLHHHHHISSPSRKREEKEAEEQRQSSLQRRAEHTFRQVFSLEPFTCKFHWLGEGHGASNWEMRTVDKHALLPFSQGSVRMKGPLSWRAAGSLPYSPPPCGSALA